MLIDNDLLSVINFGALLQIQGGLWLQQLSNLEALDGFNNIEMIGSDLRLVELSLLKELSMPYLSSVGNDLVIDNLNSLTDIDSYVNLHTIGGDLELKDNELLQNIGALMNLWILSGDFRILDNAMLPTSQIQALIEHLLLNQYNGTIVVSGNLDN